MKTITLDFDTYEAELTNKYNEGVSLISSEVNQMLKSIYNSDLKELRDKFSRIEQAEVESAIMRHQYKGLK